MDYYIRTEMKRFVSAQTQSRSATDFTKRKSKNDQTIDRQQHILLHSIVRLCCTCTVFSRYTHITHRHRRGRKKTSITARCAIVHSMYAIQFLHAQIQERKNKNRNKKRSKRIAFSTLLVFCSCKRACACTFVITCD